MADVAVTDLTFAETRVLRRLGGTRPVKVVEGTITLPASAVQYRTGGIPISGVTNSATGAVVAANALACPGLGCPNELLTLEVVGETEDTTHIAQFVAGTAGTSPHKLKLYQDNAAAAAKPFAEVADTTALNDATAFPGAPTVIRVRVTGF